MDIQKQQVYDWERTFVSPRDRTIVEFENIKPIIDYIWKSEGLKYPPLLKIITHGNKAGHANRTEVAFRKTTYTWIILHELAHSMSSTIEGTNQHNAIFLGIYTQLLSRYLKIDMKYLVETLDKSNLKYNLLAKPCFLD